MFEWSMRDADERAQCSCSEGDCGKTCDWRFVKAERGARYSVPGEYVSEHFSSSLFHPAQKHFQPSHLPVFSTTMSHEQRPSQDAGIERPTAGPEGMPPSDDSTRGLLKSVPAPQPARVSHQSAGPEPYIARLEFEPPNDEPPPRHASRQMMRWDPPTREGYDDRYNDRYDDYYDDRYERRPYSRRSYDYAPTRRMYSEDRPRGDLRMRRNVSVRDTPSKSRGGHMPPTPPGSIPKRRPEWHDPSPSDDESDDGPPKPPNRRLRAGGRSSPPPEEIMRLPFTMWMNSNAKNRKPLFQFHHAAQD